MALGWPAAAAGLGGAWGRPLALGGPRGGAGGPLGPPTTPVTKTLVAFTAPVPISDIFWSTLLFNEPPTRLIIELLCELSLVTLVLWFVFST